MERVSNTDCGDDVFSGLVALFNAVIFRKFPEPIADLDDMEEMVDMLQAVRPGVPEIDMLRGLVAVTRSDWHAAAAIFESLRERRLCVPSSDAMTAFCLSSLGDASWRGIADELLAGSAVDASHRQLVQALTAREDLQRATSEAGVTGGYTEPASVRELLERCQREQEAATPAHLDQAALLLAGAYMRV